MIQSVGVLVLRLVHALARGSDHLDLGALPLTLGNKPLRWVWWIKVIVVIAWTKVVSPRFCLSAHSISIYIAVFFVEEFPSSVGWPWLAQGLITEVSLGISTALPLLFILKIFQKILTLGSPLLLLGGFLSIIFWPQWRSCHDSDVVDLPAPRCRSRSLLALGFYDGRESSFFIITSILVPKPLKVRLGMRSLLNAARMGGRSEFRVGQVVLAWLAWVLYSASVFLLERRNVITWVHCLD